jgi:hypothetical protein
VTVTFEEFSSAHNFFDYRGSGIRVDGTSGDGLTISTYIKDAGNLL